VSGAPFNEGAYADMTLQACIDQFRKFEQWCDWPSGGA
jgi:hypothetical protein